MAYFSLPDVVAFEVMKSQRYKLINNYIDTHKSNSSNVFHQQNILDLFREMNAIKFKYDRNERYNLFIKLIQPT